MDQRRRGRAAALVAGAPDDIYRYANRAFLDTARAAGWIDGEGPIVLEIYSETLQHQPRARLRGREARRPAHWLFFAEARHVVASYYRVEAVRGPATSGAQARWRETGGLSRWHRIDTTT